VSEVEDECYVAPAQTKPTLSPVKEVKEDTIWKESAMLLKEWVGRAFRLQRKNSLARS
jgi:hypothetical protein